MFKVPSLALTAVLYGIQAAHAAAAAAAESNSASSHFVMDPKSKAIARKLPINPCDEGEFPVPGTGSSQDNPLICRPGCYPGYRDGGSYTINDPVSASIQETTPSTTESCTGTSNGCVDGSRVIPETTVSQKYNFKCNTAAWCGQSGFAPGSQYESQAWTKMEKCEGTAPESDYVPEAWTEGGCPSAYVAGGDDYDPGAIVSVDKGTYSMVYTCTSEPNNQFCNDIGYEPGTGQYWSNAWTELGSCSGSLAPTDSPSFDVLEDLGGCPNEWEQGRQYPVAGHYEEGDLIQANGIVFRCRPWPFFTHCGQDGYVPFNQDASTADAWKEAWEIAGYCSGTVGPTESPSFDVLENMGACPDKWELKINTNPYEEGDTIAVNNIVFACRAWPQSNHCGQA